MKLCPGSRQASLWFALAASTGNAPRTPFFRTVVVTPSESPTGKTFYKRQGVRLRGLVGD